MSCSISNATTFASTGSIVTYTVPATGVYDMVAYGAQGGAGANVVAGGLGAKVGGDVMLTAGEVLQIAVGGAGQTGTSSAGGGGGAGGGGSSGGGSFDSGTQGNADFVQTAGANSGNGSVVIAPVALASTISGTQANQATTDNTPIDETNGDVLDLRAALAATSWNHQTSTLGNYLKVTDSGGNTDLAIAPSGSGAGIAIATLNGVSYGPADLQSHHSLLS